MLCGRSSATGTKVLRGVEGRSWFYRYGRITDDSKGGFRRVELLPRPAPSLPRTNAGADQFRCANPTFFGRRAPLSNPRGLPLRPRRRRGDNRAPAAAGAQHGATLCTIRDDLKQIKLPQLLSSNGTVWQVTEPAADALKRLALACPATRRTQPPCRWRWAFCRALPPPPS